MATPYKITFSENNTLSTVGSYRIVSYDGYFKYVTSINSLSDSITGSNSQWVVQRSFRWSKDNTNWSLWIEYDELDQTPVTSLTFNKEDNLYIEVKFMIDDEAASPEIEIGTEISPEVAINWFDLSITEELPNPYIGYPGPTRGLCSNEYLIKPILFQNSQYTFNPYNVNQGINLYQDLSNMVNNMFGLDAVYYRVVPQRRSKDIVLKEWTVYNVDQEKCMKLVVPNNTFPDSKVTFNNFGIDFEQPFVVQVDKKYWEGFFGKGTMPQTRDVVYFPLQNRIYEIQSSYAYRDFMNQILYYKISLVKYQPKADTILSDEIANTLDNLTITTEELFGEEFSKQVERHTKPQQYVTITRDSDPIREVVLRAMPVNNYSFYNNWTLIFETYYDLLTPYNSSGVIEAVKYRPTVSMTSSQNRSFTCWFSPQNNIKNTSSTRNLLTGRNESGIGVDIDLAFSTASSQLLLTLDAEVYSFVIQKTLVADSWYALVVNWSSEFKQASVDVWETQVQTSQLLRISHEVKTLTAFEHTTDFNYRLKTSPLFLTNIRLFDNMLEDEHQNLVLSQLIVKDSEKAIIIDNAKPLLRLAQIAKPK